MMVYFAATNAKNDYKLPAGVSATCAKVGG